MDLGKLYGKSNPIPKKISDIFQRSGVKDYFYKHLKRLWLNKERELIVNGKGNSDNFLCSSASPQTVYCPDRRRSRSQSSDRIDRIDGRNTSDSSKLSNSRVSLNKDLLRDEKEVESFHQIVLAINIGWNMKGFSKNWNKVCQQMSNYTKMYKIPNVCLQTFYTWTSFYAKVFSGKPNA